MTSAKAFLCMCLMGAISMGVSAQSYPVKPIRNILTISGSGGEANPRIVAEFLSRQLGQPVIVEPQSGAGGAVGATTVARSAPGWLHVALRHHQRHGHAPVRGG